MYSGGSILRASLLGAVSGIAGTGLGGALAAVWRKPDPKAFAAMVGFSGGMMFAVTVLDLIPEAIAAHVPAGLLGILAGIAAMAVANTLSANAAPRCRRRGRLPPQAMLGPALFRQAARGKWLPQYLQAGMVVGLGIAAHNFAEGLAVGSGYVVTAGLGVKIAVLIGLHDVPEGLAMATMLRLGGASQVSAVLSSTLAGLPMAAGAFAGALAGTLSNAGLAYSLGAAGGAMLFITARLYPEGASLSSGPMLVSGTLVGLASGAFLVVAV